VSIQSRSPSILSRILRWALLRFYKSAGWRATGTVPQERRFVLIAAPHTSNWDFLYFIGLTQELGITPNFMAKRSLFRWPWRNFMLDMGGVPIDRSSANNVVDQMAGEFAQRDEFMLTIAPEGTRGEVGRWKTGFYHIAVAAKVPLVVGMMDYSTKTGGLGPAIMPSGDFDADMAKVKPLYDSVVPRHPERMVRHITGKEPARHKTGAGNANDG